jgi:hypothetical protein
LGYEAPYIFAKWHDAHANQHGQCTYANEPAKALINKLQFLEKQRDTRERREIEGRRSGKVPLKKVGKVLQLKDRQQLQGPQGLHKRISNILQPASGQRENAWAKPNPKGEASSLLASSQ